MKCAVINHHRQLLGIGILSASTLMLESTLIRLLAITQFYHFAFLVVSLALLGFGASGTFISIFPKIKNKNLSNVLIWVSLGYTVSVIASYLVINLLPFDSYSIVWEKKQLFYFVIYYFSLLTPFFFSGLAIGVAFASNPKEIHQFYGTNLLGSSLGTLITPLILNLAGVPGVIILCLIMGSIIPFVLLGDAFPTRISKRIVKVILGGFVLGLICLYGLMVIRNLNGKGVFEIRLSPYKGLRQALRYPGSKVVYGRWTSKLRIDIISNAGIRMLPGLSYSFAGDLPQQFGLSIDAENPQPITPMNSDVLNIMEYLPESIGFRLKQSPEVLIIMPRGGLGVLQALAGGADHVAVLSDDSNIQSGISKISHQNNVYNQSNVKVYYEEPRVFLKQRNQKYDILFIPLTDSFRPVTSGAYSLSENYLFTLEGIRDAIEMLDEDGIFISTRWLQVPPSEGIRLITTVATALENLHIQNPSQKIIAFRSIQTITVMCKQDGWSKEELTNIKERVHKLKFDLIWMPGIKSHEVNLYNRLQEAFYYQTIKAFFSTRDFDEFVQTYAFNITPPTDNQPFFFHFFEWQQVPEILSSIGQTWQPFGGSGYLILIAFLILATILSFILIYAPLPISFRKREAIGTHGSIGFILGYFSAIGISYLFIEIPLIQKFILFLGNPTYAFSIVLFALLFFSGLGSLFVSQESKTKQILLFTLVCLSIVYPFIIKKLINTEMASNLIFRGLLTVISLAPLAFLMGMPFPVGLSFLEKEASSLIPWAWAVNGCASVISSVVAAMLVLEHGFDFVLEIGALLYGVGILFLYFHSTTIKIKGFLS